MRTEGGSSEGKRSGSEECGYKEHAGGDPAATSKVMYMDEENVIIKPITQSATFLKNSVKSKM